MFSVWKRFQLNIFANIMVNTKQYIAQILYSSKTNDLKFKSNDIVIFWW